MTATSPVTDGLNLAWYATACLNNSVSNVIKWYKYTMSILNKMFINLRDNINISNNSNSNYKIFINFLVCSNNHIFLCI